MKETIIWLGTFSLVVATGIFTLIALWSQGLDEVITYSFRLLSIFLGVLAGITLGSTSNFGATSGLVKAHFVIFLPNLS